MAKWIGGTAAIEQGVRERGIRRSVKDAESLAAWESGGVITIPDGYAVELTAPLDLLGDRIVCAGTAAIFGLGSEVTSLTSTGLTGNPLVYAPGTLTLRDMLIVPPVDVYGVQLFSGAGAYDWRNVNFIGAGAGLLVSEAANLVQETVLYSCAQGGVDIDGDLQSFVMTNSFISAQASSYGVRYSSGALYARRQRIVDSVVVVASGAVGLNNDKTYIPISEGHILRDVNFSGAGSYVTGIAFDDEEARWYGCRGVTNSARVGLLYMTSNATATNIASAGTYYKVQGTTTLDAATQRFSHSNNRLTYTSALEQVFEVVATASISASNNRVVGIRVYKNGVAINPIVARTTISANNKVEGMYYRVFVTLAQGDYLEVFATNETSSGNMTITDLTLSARADS